MHIALVALVLLPTALDVDDADARPDMQKRAIAEWERRALSPAGTLVSPAGGAKHMIDVLQDTLGLNKRKAFCAFMRSQYMRLSDPRLRTDDPEELGFGRGDLHQAAVRPGACARTLELLVARNDPNVEDAHGMTPLILAANKGWLSRLVPLLAKGADVHVADKLSQATALAHAAIGLHYGAVSLLLAAGASADVRLQTPYANNDPDYPAPAVNLTLLEMMRDFEGEDDEDEENRQRVVWLLTSNHTDLSEEGRRASKEMLRVATLELDLYGQWNDWTSWSERDRIWERALSYEVGELKFHEEDGGLDDTRNET